jgi:hypothetical protein
MRQMRLFEERRISGSADHQWSEEAKISLKSFAPAVRGPTAAKPPAELVVRDIRRCTRKQHSAEDKACVVLEGLRGEESHCRAVPARGHRREPLLIRPSLS